MSKISRKDVAYVARLARLSLSEEEKEKFTRQLDAILKFMEKLNELDTEKTEPLRHLLPLRNVWREDKEKPSLSREKLLENAPQPDKEKKFFKVPKVIE